jgi:hypothetical protein
MKNTTTSVLNYMDDKFKVGQIWNYQTRPGEEKSTLIILKVEKYDSLGIVIHVAINDLHIKNADSPNGYSTQIGHLPFSKKALENSVTTLLSENNRLPDFLDGYKEWSDANGGVYSITINEVINNIEETFSSGTKI